MDARGEPVEVAGLAGGGVGELGEPPGLVGGRREAVEQFHRRCRHGSVTARADDRFVMLASVRVRMGFQQ
ncbi:MAG: hypothetical protein ACK5UM_11830 [Pseudomonadota bacterium]